MNQIRLSFVCYGDYLNTKNVLGLLELLSYFIHRFFSRFEGFVIICTKVLFLRHSLRL